MSSTAAEEAQIQAIHDATCYAYTPGLGTSYGYFPGKAAGIVFCVLFALPLLYHTFQSIRLRATTSILLSLGALTELIGWGSRLYSAYCPYNGDAFLAQEVTLIIAPVFFSAALYVLLGQLIIALGPSSSMLSARMYTIVFCTCDLVSLVVQAIGGAKASTADDDKAKQETGTHIMVAGIAFQLFTMTLFGLLVADFLRRVLGARGRGRGAGPGPLQAAATSRPVRMVLAAMLVSFVMIYVRSVYRTIELAQGWDGYLISHEGFFIGLDAAIMVVAVAVFVWVDPAVVFRREGIGAQYGEVAAAKSTHETSDSEVGIAMGHVREPMAGPGGYNGRY